MLSRRTFLCSSLAVAAVPAIVRGRNLNSKVQLAGIGCEGKGLSDIREMAGHSSAQFVSWCDVDLSRVEKARQFNLDAPVYQDFREMLDAQGDKIDAVTVSTPDHMHAYISLRAMRQGKHVYCQKPLTHNVWEARQMRLQAAQSDVITRMGNQIHSHEFYRTAVETVRTGALGKIRLVHSWCVAPGRGKQSYTDRPTASANIPETLDWNLWIGVAPMRPYPGWKIYHPWAWRDWQDFGNGALGDFGCHILDPVFSALQIDRSPSELSAHHSGMNQELWPEQTTVTYVFPGTELCASDNIEITWNDGGRQPNDKGPHVPKEYELPRSGSLIVGEQKTMLLPHVGAPQIFPDTKIEKVMGENHYHGWIDGVISGNQPSDGFEYGGRLTEAVLLGNIAARFPNTKLVWNDSQMRIENLAAANHWLKRSYREDWEIPSASR